MTRKVLLGTGWRPLRCLMVAQTTMSGKGMLVASVSEHRHRTETDIGSKVPRNRLIVSIPMSRKSPCPILSMTSPRMSSVFSGISPNSPMRSYSAMLNRCGACRSPPGMMSMINPRMSSVRCSNGMMPSSFIRKYSSTLYRCEIGQTGTGSVDFNGGASVVISIPPVCPGPVSRIRLPSARGRRVLSPLSVYSRLRPRPKRSRSSSTRCPSFSHRDP